MTTTKILEKRIEKLEDDMLWWKNAHCKLQEQHIRLQKTVYEGEKNGIRQRDR